MRPVLPLVRLSMWLCLLGSTLALLAFFLPFYDPPLGSLWNMFLLLIHQAPHLPTIVPSLALVLFPLLLSMEVLVCLAVGWRRPKRALMMGYQVLAIPTMLCALAVNVFAVFIDALNAAFSDSPSPALHPGQMGTWVLLVGLLVAFLGCLFAPLGAPRSLGQEHHT